MPGSHGSLTKAGKVRHGRGKHQKKQRKKTHRRPKPSTGRRADSSPIGIPVPSHLKRTGWRAVPIERTYKPKRSPRLRNRRNYVKRVLKGNQTGQERRQARWKR